MNYRLPDGKITRSQSRYIKEWRLISSPLDTLTGLKPCAFDPDIVFTDGTHTITLPVWFINIVNTALKETK